MVLADIDSLRSDSAAIAARLATKETQLRNIEDLLAIEEVPIERLATLDQPTPARSQKFVDAAWEILNNTHAPLHYRVLHEQLAAAGIYVPGKDPPANLIAHMSRDDRFGRTAGRGMYGLTAWPSVGKRLERARVGTKPPARRRVGETSRHG